MSPLGARWCKAVPSLRETALRASFFRSEPSSRGLEAIALALDELCGRAEQAEPLAREVLAAALPVLTEPELAERVDDLRALASMRSLLPLGRLLRRKSTPDPTLAQPDPDERHLSTSSSGRALTLGERKALARRPSRAALEKLLRDPHPHVIRTLLGNPRITEADVVRLAARRPAFPEIIAEIARHPKFSQRVRIRMAVVQNPWSPPEISVPLVSLLIRPELQQLLAAADVPHIVRAAATELLQRRPPVPATRARQPPMA
jgi:hypothetical protein